MENENRTAPAHDPPSPTPMALHHSPAVLRHLQRLMSEQARLEQPSIPADSPLASAYADSLQQLRVQLRRVQRSGWEWGQEEGQPQLQQRVKAILGRMRKLKELHLYFGEMRKDARELQADVQKFMAYLPKGNDLAGKLQAFLSEPAVCELLLKQHQHNINPNNFLADIIEFFEYLARHQLLEDGEQEQAERVRNEDLVLIENSKIIFRQVCEISDKYSLVEQQLLGAYVHLSFLAPAPPPACPQMRKFREEEEGVQKQMKELAALARKVKGAPAFSFEDTIVLSEEPDLFQEQARCQFDYHFKHRNQTFFTFLQSLYSTPAETLEKGGLQQSISNRGGVGNFDFIRRKIIRVEMNWHLNRVFSALNVGSHIIAQLHDNTAAAPHSYCFKHPAELIKYEFNCRRAGFYEEREATPAELQLLAKNIVVAQREEGFVLRMEMSRVVYPSAVHSYYYLLKYLLALSAILDSKHLYDQELLLEITAIKADELSQWAQTAVTLYELLRGKYWSGYPALKEYVGLAMAGRWAEELEWVEREVTNESQLLGYFLDRQRKAAWVNQIIFELDTNYDPSEALLQLLAIERRVERVAHAGDSPRLYQLVLNEIIETRNNLKFQRCYSFNALHQLFALPGAHPPSLAALAQQLAPLARHSLPLPQLLRLYHAQTRLKRQVFRAQLYWTNIAQPSVRNKFIISTQRKKATFRDFMDENAKYLLSILDQDLAFFLNNLEEVERAVLLFAQEVERLKLIQTALMLLKPDFPLEDHLAAFSHRQLLGFVGFCAGFNCVQDLFVRRQKRSWVLGQVRRLLGEGKLRFSDLNMDPAAVGQKQLLGGLIFLSHAFEHHLTLQDCLRLKQKIIDRGQPPEYHLKLQVLRGKRDVVKEYEDSQFLQGAALAQFVQIYELLIHIALNRALAREDVPHHDKLILGRIRSELPCTYAPFQALEHLARLQRLKRATTTSSTAQTYAAVACLLEEHKQRVEGGVAGQGGAVQGSEWRVLDYLFMLPQLGIVERRIFCNELVELKSAVSGEEWRSFNKQGCLGQLRQILQAELLQKINGFLIEEAGATDLLSPNLPLAHNLALLHDYTRAQLLRQYDQRFSFRQNPRQAIVLFDEERGVQQEYDQPEPSAGRVFVKKGRGNAKRGVLQGGQAEQGRRSAVVGALEQRVKVQIVKDSLDMRKTIYLLQLEQKRIRDEIAWQTCKLEHNVKNNINRFIEESTLDQKQSLINFKYTVNLETIKGIENVIHERTEIFGKKAEEAKRMKEEQEGEAAQGFITQPHPSRTLKLLSPSELQLHQPSEEDIPRSECEAVPQANPRQPSLKSVEQEQLGEREQQTLLQINLRNIFNHVRKIRLFWCWKSLFLGKQSGEQEWTRFSVNVQSILHNGANMARMARLRQERQSCNTQEILCNLVQEENQMLNTHIRNNKINHLTHKLAMFKAQHPNP